MVRDYLLIHVYCTEPFIDLIIADLSVLGYDSFLYKKEGFQAGITSQRFNEEQLRSVISQYSPHGKIHFSVEHLHERNWNELWEKNFKPVIIEDLCLIRASFHTPEKRYPVEIIIDPKMSFGTGHHETTQLMIGNQLEIDHHEKTILDVGCGTGILSVLAEKRGASRITGIDIDHWACENALENIRLNQCRKITIHQQEIKNLSSFTRFDIILANINRNTILHDMGEFSDHMVNRGLLICSGFLTDDRDRIIRKASQHYLGYLGGNNMNKWSSLVFQKKTD